MALKCFSRPSIPELNDIPGMACYINMQGEIIKQNEDFKRHYPHVFKINDVLNVQTRIQVFDNKKWQGKMSNAINSCFYISSKHHNKGIIIVMMDVSLSFANEKRISFELTVQSKLLNRLYPSSFVQSLKSNYKTEEYARMHNSVSIIFADIVGFTKMSSTLNPRTVMQVVSSLFEQFDTLCLRFGAYKYETVGDCYVVACGLMDSYRDGSFDYCTCDESEDKCNSMNAVKFALNMYKESRNIYIPFTDIPITLRIGIHTGPIASGVISTSTPKLCLFGDTINTASRMETTGIPNAIQISDSTYKSIGEYQAFFKKRLSVEVKGKGTLDTWVHVFDEN